MNDPIQRKRGTWVLRVFAFLFPFAVLALVEGVLFLADVGVDTSLVVSNDRVADGLFFLNPPCDVAYCNRDLRGPEPRSFELPKKDETFRVVVVGASSVQGYPYPSELAFPRQMELILDRQLSERTVEVLNVGVVGLSTMPLVDLVSQSTETSPDLVVLYAGHNEFYGVGGVATKASISQIGMRVRRFRLGQLLTSVFASDDPASGELIAQLPNDTAIPIGSMLVREAEEHYKKNLSRMADLCARKQIPLLICSVVSNLRDHSPSPSRSPTSLSEIDKERVDAFEGQASQLMKRGEYTDAIAPLRAALQLVPDRPETSYRLAKCLDQLGRIREASDYYTRARDLDGCRYRAPSSFHGIARQVALQRVHAAIHFVDLVPAFAQASEAGVPGHDLFLEHVHFTFAGHSLVAATIARAIVEDVCRERWRDDAMPRSEERDDWLGVTNEDHIVATKLATFLLQRPPFNESLDVERQLQALTDKIRTYSEALSEPQLQAFASLNPKTKIDDLMDGLGRAYLSRGDVDRALSYFERGKRRRPWMPNSFIFAAVCHHRTGQNEQALENIEMSRHTPMPEIEPLLIERDELWRQLSSSASPGQ